MNIKPNRYYKECYNNSDENVYYIMYTGTTVVYEIARINNNQIYKNDEKIRWGTIKEWQEYINTYNIKIEEMSKEDLFLELL